MDPQTYDNDQTYDQDDMASGQKPMRGNRPKKSYRDASPAEVKEAVKETVSKGIAAAAGAVEGVADEMESDHLPDTAGKAIEMVGETTRRIAKTTVEQAKKVKDSVTGKGGKGSFGPTSQDSMAYDDREAHTFGTNPTQDESGMSQDDEI
jgi:hypothetical protein